MTKKPITDISASVLQRLKNYSEQNRQDYGLVLTRYAIERFLYRLSQSEFADQFVLKGAQLFCLWTQEPFRPTRDLDLLRFGSPNIEELVPIIQKICTTSISVQDGIEFLTETVQGQAIHEEGEYGGIRIRLKYQMRRAGQFLQIDIGFGDALMPSPQKVLFPSILDMPSANLKSYARETVIAEKTHAMVDLGMINSRMKDFFDVYRLSMSFEFDGNALREAMQSTFLRRKTDIPEGIPLAFTNEFSDDPSKRIQWDAFFKRTGMSPKMDLAPVIQQIKTFIIPVFQGIRKKDPMKKWTWKPGQGWKE
jgi:hypothetical protein